MRLRFFVHGTEPLTWVTVEVCPENVTDIPGATGHHSNFRLLQGNLVLDDEVGEIYHTGNEFSFRVVTNTSIAFPERELKIITKCSC
jgi:hypothetical protein